MSYYIDEDVVLRKYITDLNLKPSKILMLTNIIKKDEIDDSFR